MRAAAGAGLLLLASCGGAGGVTIEAADVCPAIDAGDVEEIYGVDAVALDPVATGTCIVTPDGVDPITVRWELTRTYEEIRDTPEVLRMNAPVDIDGIGDRAFAFLNDELEDDRASVHFEVDGQTMSVIGLPSDGQDRIGEVRMLAASIAERVQFASG